MCLWPTEPATGHWHWQPLIVNVRLRPASEISIFEDQRQHLAPGSCLVLTWDEYFRFPDFGRIGNPRLPAKSGIGGTGIQVGDIRVWYHSTITGIRVTDMERRRCVTASVSSPALGRQRWKVIDSESRGCIPFGESLRLAGPGVICPWHWHLAFWPAGPGGPGPIPARVLSSWDRHCGCCKTSAAVRPRPARRCPTILQSGLQWACSRSTH